MPHPQVGNISFHNNYEFDRDSYEDSQPYLTCISVTPTDVGDQDKLMN